LQLDENKRKNTENQNRKHKLNDYPKDNVKLLRFMLNIYLFTNRAGHVERYQLQSYRFKPFFVTL
jgi:hypothetical protein